MTLGETLKLLRTEHNLTQPELAERARIEQSYLSKLENDKATPSFDIINRLAQALGLTGMGLIHKLSHSYISENLSHLPEVAAEYATVKEKRERNSKRQLLVAAALLLVGVALYMTGAKELIVSNTTWYYVSDGVIKPGEHYRQFEPRAISEIGESDTGDAVWQRLLGNKDRIERIYRQSDQNLGHDFLVEVPGGKRFFQRENSEYTPRPVNKMLEILGVLVGLAGILLALHSLWRYKKG